MSTIEVAGSTRANEQGLFQCGSCKRHYNRLDHLARHVRSHTNFKPHRCSICAKSFSRTDLLKRHVSAHDVRNAKVNNNLSRGAADDLPSRVSQACRACAANHVRCSDSKPCRRCVEKGIECVFARVDDLLAPASPVSSQASHSPTSPPSAPSSLEVHQDGQGLVDAGMSETRDAPLSVASHPPQQPSPSILHGLSGQHSHVETAMGPPAVPAGGQAVFDTDFMDAQPVLPTGCCTPTFAEWNFLPGLWSAAGDNGLPAGHPFSGIDLDELDLRFLDTYNSAVPFELGSPRRPEPSQPAPFSMDMPDSSHPASGASEAFRNHHWRFRPNHKDHGAAEEHNLSLPSDARDNPSPDSHISFPRRVTATRLSTAARDNILTVVIKSCQPENLPRAVASFPSVDLLDTLIQFYLTSPQARADSFIHAATFDPNEKRPELLLAMAAAGAVLTADPTLSKLGYAIQECVRIAIPRVWESDNTLVRTLELTQAFLIILEIGLWSGVSRKVEITESFLQSPLTMFRRGGRFRKSSYPPIALDHLTSDDASWRAWIQQESFKRTAFRLVQHDLNSSMYLMVNPLVSYAELSLPLPCAPSLWAAPTAQQWKGLLVSHPYLAHQPPTVADYLDDPGAFNSPTLLEHVPDITIANEAFLACAWSLAWECIQLTSLHRSSSRPALSSKFTTSSRRWNPFLLTSRREELLRLLDHFRLTLQAQTGPDPAAPSTAHGYTQASPSHQAYHYHHHHQQQQQSQQHQQHPHDTAMHLRMRLELILLHLHAPFEEIQIVAGIEGPEQARAAYAGIRDWSATEAARRAVCHAGQVVRFARPSSSSSSGGGGGGGSGGGGGGENRRDGAPRAATNGGSTGEGGGEKLQGPGAMVMYQASLVLWVWGLVRASEELKGKSPGSVGASAGGGTGGKTGEEDAVWLDGRDDLALQRFVQFGLGTPKLTKGSSRTASASASAAGEAGVSLGDPEAVLGEIIGILRDNYDGLPKPHLVERLLQLMEALQRSSAGMMELHGQAHRQ